MTRKVFQTHYIELIGCSSSAFLLRCSKHLMHPAELKLHNTPEKSYRSKLSLEGGENALLSSRMSHLSTEPGSSPCLGEEETPALQAGRWVVSPQSSPQVLGAARDPAPGCGVS